MPCAALATAGVNAGETLTLTTGFDHELDRVQTAAQN